MNFPLAGVACPTMELRRIQYFVAVAEECHFGRAAVRLRVGRAAAVAAELEQLESEMGVTLFARSTRRVELTAAGQRFLDRAREILSQNW